MACRIVKEKFVTRLVDRLRLRSGIKLLHETSHRICDFFNAQRARECFSGHSAVASVTA
jgi:hypothetical protein